MKECENYKGYFVDRKGCVVSYKHGYNRILRQFTTNRGYKKVVLFRNNKANGKLVHRLVALAFIPNPKNKPQVNHKDGNKINNTVSNLEWATASENGLHSYSIGKSHVYHGQDHVKHKLKEEDVVKIKSLKGIISQERLSFLFNVSQTNISLIHRGKAWSHLADNFVAKKGRE